MEMHGKECFVVGTDGRLQQLLPKHSILLPSRPQIFRVMDRDSVQIPNRKRRDLRAYTRSHTEEQARCSWQGAPDVPELHQYFPQKRFRLSLIDNDRTSSWNPNFGICSTRSLPPVESVEVEIEQEYRTAPSALAGALIYLLPERHLTIDRAPLNWGTGLSALCQHLQVSCIQSVQCRYCLQTGPPVRPWRRAIPTHIPIRCYGIGGGFSLDG